jgi:hypothetical protein
VQVLRPRFLEENPAGHHRHAKSEQSHNNGDDKRQFTAALKCRRNVAGNNVVLRHCILLVYVNLFGLTTVIAHKPFRVTGPVKKVKPMLMSRRQKVIVLFGGSLREIPPCSCRTHALFTLVGSGIVTPATPCHDFS